MRYLGLDVGQKNIGVATGELLAKELITLSAPKDKNYYDQPDLAQAELTKIIEQEQADAIVVGLPVNEQGEPTNESEKIEKLCHHLEKELNIAFHFVDETLTSFMAKDILEGQGLSVAQAAVRVHQLSAELILQQFLENNVG